MPGNSNNTGSQRASPIKFTKGPGLGTENSEAPKGSPQYTIRVIGTPKTGVLETPVCVVLKFMGPFWLYIISRHLIFRGTNEWDPNGADYLYMSGIGKAG